jgi:hypothetical protein
MDSGLIASGVEPCPVREDSSTEFPAIPADGFVVDAEFISSPGAPETVATWIRFSPHPVKLMSERPRMPKSEIT